MEDLERLNIEFNVEASAVPLELARIEQLAPGLFAEAGQSKASPTKWDPRSEAHARRRRVPKHPPAGWKGPRQK